MRALGIEILTCSINRQRAGKLTFLFLLSLLFLEIGQWENLLPHARFNGRS